MRYEQSGRLALIVGMSMFAIAGCASIKSTKLPASDKNGVQGGLVYYLPMQRLELTLTVTEVDPCKKAADQKQKQEAKDDQDKSGCADGASTQKKIVRTVNVGVSPVFGDPTERYVAQYRRNHIGSNMLKVSANVDGLLSGEGTGSTTSGVSEFLKQLASAAGGAAVSTASRAQNPCAAAGVYKWTLDENIDSATIKSIQECGISVTVKLISGKVLLDFKSTVKLAANGTSDSQKPRAAILVASGDGLFEAAVCPTAKKPSTDSYKRQDYHFAKKVNAPGYFYRQKLAVEISVKDGMDQKVFYTSFVGCHSPIEFLPIPKTVFADASWKVSFTDGMPTLYEINAGGDVLGLVKLPADVVKAYSQAVLAGLNDKKGLAEAEVQYLQQLNALSAQQVKYELCRTAAQTGDPDKIKAACQ